MTLNQHIALTGVAAAALSPFMGGTELAMFAVGSVLFDTDHYFVYIQRKKNFNVRGMFSYFHTLDQIYRSVPYAGLFIFHTIEFFLLLGLLAHFQPIFRPLLYGVLFHFTIDLIDLIRKDCPFIRAFSIVEHLIRRRRAGYPYY